MISTSILPYSYGSIPKFCNCFGAIADSTKNARWEKAAVIFLKASFSDQHSAVGQPASKNHGDRKDTEEP